MRHLLVEQIEKAFGWSDPSPLGRSFARGTTADPSLCERLLTPERFIELVMRRSLAPPQFRCLQNGQEVHPRSFTSTRTTRRAQPIPMVDMDRLGKLIQDGMTAVLDSTDTFDPTLEVACRALQWWTGELVKVNTYLTTRDASGFDLHWDDHDVIVVQVAGAKSWEVRAATRVAPMFRDTEPPGEPSTETVWSGTMTAGDIMHIPRGFWHRATRAERGEATADDFSLHVTFGIEQRTGVDWIAWLADQARANELFRRDLGAQPDSSTLAEAIAELADTHGPRTFVAERRRTQPVRRHPSTWGVFGIPDTIVCMTEFQPDIDEADDGSVAVEAAGRRVRFAAKALPALRMLLSGAPVSVAEVGERTGLDARRIADILLQESICGEASPESSSAYTGLVTSD
jgi:hypothetical protein